MLAPASAGDGEAPEKQQSSGGRRAGGLGPLLAPCTCTPRPEASALRQCGSLPGLSDLCQVTLSLGGGSSSRLVTRCPLGRHQFSSGPPTPTPVAALQVWLFVREGATSSQEPCRSPRGSPGAHTASSAPQVCLGPLDMGATAERWRPPALRLEPEPRRPLGRPAARRSGILRPGPWWGLGPRAPVRRPAPLALREPEPSSSRPRGAQLPHPVLPQLQIRRRP